MTILLSVYDEVSSSLTVTSTHSPARCPDLIDRRGLRNQARGPVTRVFPRR